MQVCITIFLGFNQPTAFGRLHSKLITIQRWILELFVIFVNGKKLLIIITKYPLLVLAEFADLFITVNNWRLLECLP